MSVTFSCQSFNAVTVNGFFIVSGRYRYKAFCRMGEIHFAGGCWYLRCCIQPCIRRTIVNDAERILKESLAKLKKYVFLLKAAKLLAFSECVHCRFISSRVLSNTPVWP